VFDVAGNVATLTLVLDDKRLQMRGLKRLLGSSRDSPAIRYEYVDY
jgi:hypothetical protein